MLRSYLICGALLFAGCKDSPAKDEGAKAAAAKGAEPAAAGASGGNPFAKSAEAVVDGRKLYLQYGCAGCHGMGGGGGMGKPLSDDEWKFGSDDQTLFKLVRGEIPNQTMPSSIGKSLSDEEIWKVLLYVRSIYNGDTAKINWTVPPPVTPEMLAAANPPAADPLVAGKQIFLQVCATCHGQEGHGDGPASATLDPKPRNLADPAYMGPLNERYMFELISRGGLAMGKSAMMPAQPGLPSQDVNNVIAYVKTLSAR